MRYFNNSDLRQYLAAIKASEKLEEEYLSECCVEKKEKDAVCDVFLSFSKKDIHEIAPVIKFIKDFNVNVSLDCNGRNHKERTLGPEFYNKKIAQIKNCRKYITLVTLSSSKCRWLPWELGIASEIKSMQNIAVLIKAVSFTTPPWSEMDYLGFYPKICFHNYEWMVRDHSMQTFTPFDKWLKQN